MKLRLVSIGLLGLAGLLATSPARAMNITVFDAAASGISQMTWSVGYDSQLGLDVLDIYETWTQDARSFLKIEGMPVRTNYLVRKHVLNDTGIDWFSFSHELLDKAGQSEDVLDPAAQPVWAPGGWTTSNDLDGLSFAQTSNLPQTSQQFASLIEDVTSDRRDFLDFYEGLVLASGGLQNRSDVMSFGLRDNGIWDNQPFLLTQAPNQFSGPPPPPPIPEPATLALLGTGLALGAARRRRRRG